VAVKVFRLDLTPEQSAALVEELQRLVGKGINHPWIAAPIAAGLESGAAFLAQEYAVGDSLDVVLRERGPLPVVDVVHLVGSLADAIDAAADAGATHGSLHPRDVIFSPDGGRITGFGIAGALLSIGARVPVRPPYSALEHPSDVYSLAAIAFEAMSGRRLSAPNLEEFEHEMTGPELREAFSTAVALDPGLRPARASDFASALRKATGLPAGITEAAPLAPVALLAPVAPPAPEEVPFEIDRYAEAGAVEDLRMEFSQPEPEAPTPPAASWTVQPPELFQSDGADAERKGRGGLLAILLICGLGVGLAFGYYYLRSRSSTASTQQPGTKSGISETTVDLPPSAQPSPPAASPPAPTPSRPASGAAPKFSARSPTASARGNLMIRSSPPNADVSVNGQARGKTPITMRDLPLGSYTIRVARDGYAPDQRRVELTARRATAAISFSLQSASSAPSAPATTTPAPSERIVASGVGRINVQSRPSGARVFVNDRLIGITPLAVPDMPAGPATVRIEMDGYQAWTTTVQVTAAEPARVNASLERR
jgi:serine/threonine protein kinase